MEYKLENRSLSSSTIKKKPKTPKDITQLTRSTESRRKLLRNVSMPTVINLKAKSFKKKSPNNISHENIPFTVKPKSRDNSHLLNSSKKDLIQFIRAQHFPLPNAGNFTLRIIEKPKLLIKNDKKTPRLEENKPNTSRGRLSIRARPNSKEKANFVLTQSLISPTFKEIKKAIRKYASKTKTGNIGGVPKKENQDAWLVRSDFANTHNQFLLSVMDGHGIFGHKVSAFVKKTLPLRIEGFIPSEVTTKNVLTSEDISKIKHAMAEGYLKVSEDLVNKKQIDITYSGSTAVSVLIRGDLCICANVGDSRAVIGRFDGIKWSAMPLSRDHKPNDPLEQLRIVKCGGRVEPYVEESGRFVGPHRVWMKNEQVPGLAMSRALGDFVASQVGVIAEPEIIEHRLTEADKFIIIASDGIWEFLSSQDCVNIVASYFQLDDAEGACARLTEESEIAWKKHDDVTDDITVIVAFLNT
ncbi:unnamed protein product [Blepharisma stoltei]|uniref:PPM-type phosphatase domain-containing protein n=1 Tax=Blepharisma stoltei TaxID=1481888 RepID=A0AAU9K783_9CILI|nr:unnamed protein product [Blepharisma stoltei]